MNGYTLKENIYAGIKNGYYIGSFISLFPLCTDIISSKNFYDIRVSIVKYPISILNISFLGGVIAFSYSVIKSLDTIKHEHFEECAKSMINDAVYISK